ncbi:MAG TPA: hypothetical protein VFU81_18885 [Thermomicrobiales bacterium]|nr:hypothetical protein [Thermomicrobiales bacterium]
MAAISRVGAAAPTPPGWRANGTPCDHKQPGQCCSGNCKKSGKRHRCKPALGAQGCTVDHDLCQGDATRCPDNPRGFCVGRNDGEPFCTPQVVCVPCATGADCDRAFQREGGVCIADCAFSVSIGLISACVFPPAA